MSEHVDSAKCSCCSISRRCFLAMAGAGAAGAALASAGLAVAAEGDLKEYIDIASFRPKPKVLIKSVVARVHPPYWLGWPGTSYDLEGHRKEYAACFADSAKRVGIELDAVEAPLESDEAVDAFVKSLEGEKPDAVLVSLQHLDSGGGRTGLRRRAYPRSSFHRWARASRGMWPRSRGVRACM